MPKKHSARDIKYPAGGIHPNSRKAKQLKRILTCDENKRCKFVDRFNSKWAPKLEKLLFFQQYLQENNITEPISVEELHKITDLYLARHDEELEEILELHAIRKNRPKASREAQLKFTKEREMDEYVKGAFEVPDLSDELVMARMLQWNGDHTSCNVLTLRNLTKPTLS